MSKNNGEIRLSVVAAALSDDVRRAPRLSRDAGFAGLQFDAYSPALRIPDLSASGRREFRQLVGAQDQQLAGLRADLGAKGFGPGADVDRLLDRLDQAMEAAAGLAAPLLCVDLGPLPAPPQQPKSPPKIRPEDAGIILLPTADDVAKLRPAQEAPALPFDADFAGLVDSAMTELGRRADRYNVTVAFRGELAGLDALERALLAARCPWFGVDLDPVSLLRDHWSNDEFFSRLGPLVRHVRGRDALAGTDRRTKPTPLGGGSTNWEELLSALDESGYAGWLTLDPIELPNRTAAAVGGAEVVRRLSR